MIYPWTKLARILHYKSKTGGSTPPAVREVRAHSIFRRQDLKRAKIREERYGSQAHTIQFCRSLQKPGKPP